MEEPVTFNCKNNRLFGVLHTPDNLIDPTYGVVIITGGPQVRTGAHRLFVQLSRFLCENNCLSLRFDYEGLGDSEGEFRGFKYTEDSITAAVDFLENKFKNINIVLWSLCDGATASVLYCAKHEETIKGMVLCNPLVLTDEGLAVSEMKHYYFRKIVDKGLYKKIFQFQFNLGNSVSSFYKVCINALKYITNRKLSNKIEKSLTDIVFDDIMKIHTPMRIILSTDDIVASNFEDELSRRKSALKDHYESGQVANYIIEGADHTFIDPGMKNKLFEITKKSIEEIILYLKQRVDMSLL